jgi:hypothetical protein
MSTPKYDDRVSHIGRRQRRNPAGRRAPFPDLRYAVGDHTLPYPRRGEEGGDIAMSSSPGEGLPRLGHCCRP